MLSQYTWGSSYVGGGGGQGAFESGEYMQSILAHPPIMMVFSRKFP